MAMVLKSRMLQTIDKSKLYVLACSFGPDSMTLFDLLEKEGIRFVVCHVNYHHRKEADGEEASLREYCDHHHVQFFLHSAYYSPKRGNFQSWARDERYRFFNQIYINLDAAGLFIGHQQDDNIETFLMQQKRKNMVIYYGIAAHNTIFNMQVYRPLLEFTKAQTLEYCQENNIPHTIDSSNLGNDYLRNQIRHSEVEPMSSEERTKILEETELTNEKLRETQERMNEKFIQFKKLYIPSLLELTNQEFTYVMYKFITTAIPPRKFSGKMVEEIRKMIVSPKPNISLKVKPDYVVQKEYDFLIIYCDADVKDYSYELVLPGKMETPYFTLDFTGDTTNRNVSIYDYPLQIRNIRPGDTIKIKDYIVKVRRLYIDWKMPAYLRKRWPIIVNKFGELIYIPRYSKNFVPTETNNLIIK